MSTTTIDRHDALELLEAFHALPAGDPRRNRLRDELVRAHLPLVHHLARRIAHRADVIDDVVQVGCIGLINAIDRFDPSLGIAFTSYAVPTITGEMRRYFRDCTWTIRVPRRAIELQFTLRNAEAALEQTLGRAPTIDELAERLDTSAERVIEAREAARVRDPLPIDVPNDDGDVSTRSIPFHEHGYEDAELRASLRPVLSRLAARDREILMLRFVGQHTQAEIGRRVGVSQMQVGRRLNRSLQQMREILENEAAATGAETG